jgi:ABC-2 type transport system ATP-binding protein
LLVDGVIRIEQDNGHAFIPQLVEAFPGKIDSVTISKPTLEDVFIHKTGHRFWEDRDMGGEK